MEEMKQRKKYLSIDRRQRIMTAIRKSRSVEVSDLSNSFEVSPVTIRKDLEVLENKGLIIRTHGGAALNEKLHYEPSFGDREDKYSAEKKSIALEAVKLIDSNMTIVLNAGTTTNEIAYQLRNLKDIYNLTVVTNALNVAWYLKDVDFINVFLTGGRMRPQTYALVGDMTEQSIEHLFFDIAFIGVRGLSLEYGLTTPTIEEAKISKLFIQKAAKAVCVTDHTKLNEVTFSRISNIESIDTLITDKSAEPKTIEKLQELNLNIIMAK